MTRIILIFSILILIGLIYILFKNMDNTKIRNRILTYPIILGMIIYFLVSFVSAINLYGCDGAAIIAIFISFISITIGLILNIINFLYRLIKTLLNIKYGKLILIFLIILIVLFIVFFNNNYINRAISKDLDITMPYSLYLDYNDTHGGFHGDGQTIAKVSITNKNIDKIINSNSNWNKGIIPKYFNSLLYTDNYSSSIISDLNIKTIDNGYWIYLDRFNDNKYYKDYEAVDIINTGNYSLGLIDLDRMIFYYIKFDS